MLSMAQTSVGKPSSGLTPQIGNNTRMSILSNTSQLPANTNRNSNNSATAGAPSDDGHVYVPMAAIPRDSTFSSTPPDTPRMSRNSFPISYLKESPSQSRITSSNAENSEAAESLPGSKRSSVLPNV